VVNEYGVKRMVFKQRIGLVATLPIYQVTHPVFATNLPGSKQRSEEDGKFAVVTGCDQPYEYYQVTTLE
jgi:hypothetical protein